jgi:hypothetical protein
LLSAYTLQLNVEERKKRRKKLTIISLPLVALFKLDAHHNHHHHHRRSLCWLVPSASFATIHNNYKVKMIVDEARTLKAFLVGTSASATTGNRR